MNKIVIYGVGGMGKDCLELIKDLNKIESQWEILGFIDDNKKIGTNINGYKVLGDFDWINNFKEQLNVCLGIGDSIIRFNTFKKIKNPKILFPNLIHPSVKLPSSPEDYQIGIGNVICFNCFISVNTIIGNFNIFNYNSTVGHDVRISDFCSIMPGVNISGHTKILSFVNIGCGAQIIPSINIEENCTIGAGSVIIKDIEKNATVVGNPGKIVKIKNL